MAHPLDKFKYCPACGSEHFSENGPYSKKCESCGFTYYDNPKAATVAIIIAVSPPKQFVLVASFASNK